MGRVLSYLIGDEVFGFVRGFQRNRKVESTVRGPMKYQCDIQKSLAKPYLDKPIPQNSQSPSCVSTLVPSFDEKPFICPAGIDTWCINDCASFPLVGNDVRGTADPLCICVGWTFSDLWENGTCQRGVAARITISTKINRLALFHEIPNPIETSEACLPDCEPRACVRLKRCRRPAMIHLSVNTMCQPIIAYLVDLGR